MPRPTRPPSGAVLSTMVSPSASGSRHGPPITDPWEEQRRRAGAHRRARRRRRWIRVAVVGGVVVAALAAVGVAQLITDSEEATPDGSPNDAVGDDSVPESAATSVAVMTTLAVDTTTTVAPLPTTAPGRPVDVDEAWLLDRGDGEFDWGLTVRVPEGAATRSGVAVRVRLIGADDDVLDEIERTLDGVSDRGATAVAGRLGENDGTPTRLDFDVTVGEVADEVGLPDVLATRAVERDGDRLTGRIRSIAADELTDIAMVLVWREPPDGDGGGVATASAGLEPTRPPIIDVVVYEIDRLRPGIDAVFDIDLADLRTPDGLPDDVFWAPSR